jgi:hypothetical protein
MTNRNRPVSAPSRERLVRFYERVHRALSARPGAGPFDLTQPDEAAALMACTVVSVHRQMHGDEPDFGAELAIATELVGKVAFATSIPREVLKKGIPDA